jgi:cation diffusion facilitator CzcD-associated flavoprotein CzcO
MVHDLMSERVDQVDVIIVGAGLSGIGAACHLQEKCPDRRFLLLEGREDLGGTWDLFRYPGVRSDSDMHTLGYGFKPWKGAKSITDGASILDYIRETAAEHGIVQKIRFRHRVTAASWSSADNRWTVTAMRADSGETLAFACSFLLVCAGYYRYEAGYRAALPVIDAFKGTLVHPQAWPDDLDHAGKRVLVIGSGATAVTLVPAMAKTAAHVTMVQRSPTYVVAMPDTDVVADGLRRILPAGPASRLIRWKNVRIGEFLYARSRKKPEKLRRMILKQAKKCLGSAVDVDRHFSPAYNPWDQRLCLVPNGDLFEALKGGRASVVTDEIRTFTATGLELASGARLEADIVVTATGLEILALGGIAIRVDGAAVDFSTCWTYKGVAYSDVPNLVSIFGYINASWTLRVDLIADYVCRLLNHMRATGAARCTPQLRPSDRDMAKRPLIEGFSSGYIQRALPTLPRQGDREPWLNPQSYTQDRRALAKGRIDDGVMTFS